MPRKLRQLRSDLLRYGWYVIRQTGSHQTWHHDDHPEMAVNLAGHDGNDAKPYQEREVTNAIEAVRKGGRTHD